VATVTRRSCYPRATYANMRLVLKETDTAKQNGDSISFGEFVCTGDPRPNECPSINRDFRKGVGELPSDCVSQTSAAGCIPGRRMPIYYEEKGFGEQKGAAKGGRRGDVGAGAVARLRSRRVLRRG
jgi:hypothetical protein